MSFSLVAILGVALFVLWLWSGLWAFDDAECRGKPGWAVCLLVLIAWWPIGLLVWIVFRPPIKQRPPLQRRCPLVSLGEAITAPFVLFWQEIRVLFGK